MKKIQKSAVRFDNLKQDFLDDKKYSGTAEATLNGYRYDITRFLKFLSDEQLAVNEAGFKRYVIHLTDSGMTANSVNHYIRSVKVFLYWCMEQDEIAPFKIKMVKAQETIKDVYTQEELCALIQPPKREDSFVVWRSWAIINFILGTAAREATVCEMQMQDISFDDRTITFRHLKNKHVQLLPMSEALASCLKKYISLWRQDADETAYLFPSFYDEPLSTNALKHSQARYNRSRGVEKTSVHLLRHSFVKNWCMSGGNVFKLQKVLGHSTLTMTQHYANLYSNDLREGFDSHAALDRGSSSTSGKTSTSNNKDSYGHTKGDAFAIAEKAVKGKLKSPSTAKFCSVTEATIGCSGNTWVVRGWVDAQNGFGATVRTQFAVTFTFASKDMYSLDSCIVT